MFKVAIVGRANVGKSSLFNRLIGKQKSIVADTPGVTRDRIEGTATLLDLKFNVIDTGGIFGVEQESLAEDIKKQANYAIQEADLLLFVVDAKVGITSQDRMVSQLILKSNKPCIVVVNKAEAGALKTEVYEFYQFGITDIAAISVAHNLGMDELHEAISKYYVPPEEDITDDKPIMISIVGRPNSGKSTLLNTIIGQERTITGDFAGLTRDSVDVMFKYRNRSIQLVDTAGIRRRKLINNDLEKFSVEDSFDSINFSQVVILLIDAKVGLDKHEASLASKIIEEGRCLIVAINKWDIVEDKNGYFNIIKQRIEDVLPQVSGIPVLYISAKENKKLDKLLDACLDIYKIWNQRISTAKLNEWLRAKLSFHPLPIGNHGKRIKIKYITQYKTRPPTFRLFCNMPDALGEDYLRYLANHLRKDFNLYGVPLRLNLTKIDNPYVK